MCVSKKMPGKKVSVAELAISLAKATRHVKKCEEDLARAKENLDGFEQKVCNVSDGGFDKTVSSTTSSAEFSSINNSVDESLEISSTSPSIAVPTRHRVFASHINEMKREVSEDENVPDLTILEYINFKNHVENPKSSSPTQLEPLRRINANHGTITKRETCQSERKDDESTSFECTNRRFLQINIHDEDCKTSSPVNEINTTSSTTPLIEDAPRQRRHATHGTITKRETSQSEEEGVESTSNQYQHFDNRDEYPETSSVVNENNPTSSTSPLIAVVPPPQNPPKPNRVIRAKREASPFEVSLIEVVARRKVKREASPLEDECGIEAEESKFVWLKFNKRTKFLPGFIYKTSHGWKLGRSITLRKGKLSIKSYAFYECRETIRESLKCPRYKKALETYNGANSTSFQ